MSLIGLLDARLLLGLLLLFSARPLGLIVRLLYFGVGRLWSRGAVELWSCGAVELWGCGVVGLRLLLRVLRGLSLLVRASARLVPGLC